MSSVVPASFITKWNDDVHFNYQRMTSKLESTVRTDGNVKGKTVEFHLFGERTMKAKPRNGPIPHDDTTHSTVPADLVDRYDLQKVDDFDQLKTNVKLADGYKKNQAWAAKREHDQFIIDAMVAGTPATVLNAASLTRNICLEACEGLDDNDVDEFDRYCVVTPRQWNHLMTVEEFKSGDYVGQDLPYKKLGFQVRTWLGTHWIKHTGLPGAKTGAASCFMWHKSAIGLGIGEKFKTKIQDRADEFNTHISCGLSMGAVMIDPEGIVEIQVDDTQALA